MRLLALVILLLLPAKSFSQFRLKYVGLNWSPGGSFGAPKFKQFINTYNTTGPKPPGVTNYGFKVRSFGADGFAVTTGFGVNKAPVLFTLSYVGGSTLIDGFGEGRSAAPWRKSLNYDYNGFGAGLMLHLFKSHKENSVGFPRIEYQLGLNRENNVLQYRDNSGVNNKYKTHNYAVSSFIQYNFYTPFLEDAPFRIVWGINLRYHHSLNPVDFSLLPKDLGFSYSNKLSESFKDLTLGVTLGFLHYGKIKKSDNKPTPGQTDPMRMLELRAVDSVTLQKLNSRFDVVSEDHSQKVPVLYDKYILHSTFHDMLTVYATAYAKGYFAREVAIEGWDTLKVVSEIRLAKIPQSPIGIFYFEKSSSQTTEDYATRIDSVISVLQRNHHMNIAVVGHTSADGISRLNHRLSLKRASVISKMLIKGGVDKERITVTGMGSTRPRVVKDTEDSQRLNRRVEVYLRN